VRESPGLIEVAGLMIPMINITTDEEMWPRTDFTGMTLSQGQSVRVSQAEPARIERSSRRLAAKDTGETPPLIQLAGPMLPMINIRKGEEW
jgi:hypothetical protein